MHMRVTRGQAPPEQIERAITDFKQRIMPAARQAGGYAGSGLYVNRETGETRAITLWDSAGALAATGRWVSGANAQVAEYTGFRIVDVERFQIVLFDRAQPPEASSCVRVDNGYTELERQDDWARLVRDEVAPVVRESKGYCSMALCVDRTSGAVVATSDWETAEDREAAAPAFMPVLQRAAEVTLTPIRLEMYEQAVTDLLF